MATSKRESAGTYTEIVLKKMDKSTDIELFHF